MRTAPAGCAAPSVGLEHDHALESAEREAAEPDHHPCLGHCSADHPVRLGGDRALRVDVVRRVEIEWGWPLGAPDDLPPRMRQRPFCIAGDWHIVAPLHEHRTAWQLAPPQITRRTARNEGPGLLARRAASDTSPAKLPERLCVT
jgi:hypothetical protein